jgi:hypothetical protein
MYVGQVNFIFIDSDTIDLVQRIAFWYNFNLVTEIKNRCQNESKTRGSIWKASVHVLSMLLESAGLPMDLPYHNIC